MLGRHRKASGGTLDRNSWIGAIRETERLGKLQLGQRAGVAEWQTLRT